MFGAHGKFRKQDRICCVKRKLASERNAAFRSRRENELRRILFSCHRWESEVMLELLMDHVGGGASREELIH